MTPSLLWKVPHFNIWAPSLLGSLGRRGWRDPPVGPRSHFFLLHFLLLFPVAVIKHLFNVTRGALTRGGPHVPPPFPQTPVGLRLSVPPQNRPLLFYLCSGSWGYPPPSTALLLQEICIPLLCPFLPSSPSLLFTSPHVSNLYIFSKGE